MSRKPCLIISLLYIIGILINIPYSYFFLIILLTLFFILFFLKNKASIIVLYILIILFGSFFSYLNAYKGPFHIANHIGEEGDIIGTIIYYPKRYKDRISFILDVEKFKGKKAKGRVSVNTKNISLSLGNKILIPHTKIRKPSVYKNPGRYDRKRLFLIKKVYGVVYSDNIVILKEVDPFLKIIGDIKLRGEQIISLYFPSYKDLLLGIVLGETSFISQETYKVFQKTGTIHILSVSGLHLGLLFGFFVIVLGALGIKKPYKFILTIPILFLFCLITGSSIPTVRSLIMALVLIFSISFKKEANIINTLSLAALIILILNPYEIYDIGFQLSFIACLSLAILTPKLSFSKDKISLFLSSCIAASLGTAPPVLFWFSQVSLISPLSNFFIIPIIGILLPLSLLFILVGFINISLASIFVLPIEGLIKLTTSLLFFFSNLAGSSIILPSPPIYIVIFLYLLIIAFSFRIKRLFIPLLVILNIIIWYNVFKPKGCEVVFLDVGRGDSVFIRSAAGSNILIDGGPPPLGKLCIIPFLQYKGIERIDLLIATHSDIDHIGGLADIISSFNVKKVFYNGLSSPSLTYKEFEEKIKEKGLSLERLKMSDRIKMKDLDILVLNPPHPYFSDDNNNSLVLKLNFKNISFLFPGDIEEEAISFISKMYKERLNATILKAPHHGRDEIPQYFLNFVNPRLIIAQGYDNPFILSTKRYGAITIKGNNGFSVKTYVKYKYRRVQQQ